MKQFGLAIALATAMVAPAAAQDQATPARLEVTPMTVQLESGEQLDLQVTVYDSAGNVIDIPVRFFSRPRGGLAVSPQGHVETSKGGEYTVYALVSRPRLMQQVTVSVEYPPLREVAITGQVPRLFVVRSSATAPECTTRPMTSATSGSTGPPVTPPSPPWIGSVW